MVALPSRWRHSNAAPRILCSSPGATTSSLPRSPPPLPRLAPSGKRKHNICTRWKETPSNALSHVMMAISRWPQRSLASAVLRCIDAWPNMDFRAIGTSQFVLGVSIRAIALGGLTILFVQLILHTQLYATSCVVAGVAAVIIADLARCVTRADRRIEHFVDRLEAGDVDVLAGKRSASGRSPSLVDDTLVRAQTERVERQQ